MSEEAPFWPSIKIADASGIVAVDMLGVTFFLDPDACSNPSHAIRAFKSYLRAFGRYQAFSYLDDEGEIFPLPSDPSVVLERQIAEPALASETARMALVDGGQPPYRYLAWYLQSAVDLVERAQGERIPIWFRLPQNVVVEVGLDAVIAFASELAEFLPYSYGYVSPVLTCEDSFLNALPFIHRYPGLDVADAASVAIDIDDRPLGAYWVNFFGPDLSQTLGGAETLRSVLPAAMRVTATGHGGSCVIVGAAPDIGDANRQNDLPLYRELAAVLRPYMQVPSVTYFVNEQDMADREAQEAWHCRFF